MGNRIPSLSKKIKPSTNGQIRKDVYFDKNLSSSNHNLNKNIKDKLETKGNNNDYNITSSSYQQQMRRNINDDDERDGIEEETLKNINILSGMIRDTKELSNTLSDEQKQEYLKRTSPDYSRLKSGISDPNFGTIKSNQMRRIINGEDIDIEGVKKEEIEAIRKYLSIPKSTRLDG